MLRSMSCSSIAGMGGPTAMHHNSPPNPGGYQGYQGYQKMNGGGDGGMAQQYYSVPGAQGQSTTPPELITTADGTKHLLVRVGSEAHLIPANPPMGMPR